jgi:hypothetical protein
VGGCLFGVDLCGSVLMGCYELGVWLFLVGIDLRGGGQLLIRPITGSGCWVFVQWVMVNG